MATECPDVSLSCSECSPAVNAGNCSFREPTRSGKALLGTVFGLRRDTAFLTGEFSIALLAAESYRTENLVSNGSTFHRTKLCITTSRSKHLSAVKTRSSRHPPIFLSVNLVWVFPSCLGTASGSTTTLAPQKLIVIFVWPFRKRITASNADAFKDRIIRHSRSSIPDVQRQRCLHHRLALIQFANITNFKPKNHDRLPPMLDSRIASMNCCGLLAITVTEP